MSNKIMIRFFILSIFFFSNAALADPVDNAYKVCETIDAADISSSPCKVSGWRAEIIATIDTSSAEARTLCVGMVEIMRAKGISFYNGSRKWTLQIKSPYSGEKSIAYCNL